LDRASSGIFNEGIHPDIPADYDNADRDAVRGATGEQGGLA
jgi:hypothetical protein